MKDYIQVSESVFRKAELRIAENKRRSTIIRRNTIAASGAAAVLFAGMWQNDGIRNAIKSLPELASNAFTHDIETSSYTTTAPEPESTTQTETTTLEGETSSSEAITHTTTKKTTSETTETNTTTESTTAPVTTTLSWFDSLPRLNMGNWGEKVISSTDELLELESGIKINVAKGQNNLTGVFHTGDILKYDANFAYDDNEGIYYYINGSFHLYEPVRSSSDNNPDSDPTENPTEAQQNEEDEYKPTQDEFPFNELGEQEDYFPWLYLELNEDAIEYSFIKESKNFKMVENQDYKIHVTGIKIKKADDYMLVTEDDQEWYLPHGQVYGLTPEEFENLSEGDTVDFVGYFMVHEGLPAYSGLQVRFEKLVKKDADDSTE